MLIRIYKSALFLVAMLVTGAVLQGCRHAESADDQKEQKFQVTDTLQNSLLIDTVKEASALSEINLTGSIAPDENKTVKIFPMVSGVAQDVHVQLGDVVSQGQTLAIMKSAEMAGFTKDYISSEAELRSAKRNFE